MHLTLASLVLGTFVLPSAAQSIYGHLSQRNDTTIFKNLVDAVGQDLVKTLSNLEATVFVPTDAAMQNFDSNILNDLLNNSDWYDHLVEFVHYHVLTGLTIQSSGMSEIVLYIAKNRQPISFLIDSPVVGTITVRSGDAPISIIDFGADNGVMHFMDGFLTPIWTRFSLRGLIGSFDPLSKYKELAELSGFTDILDNEEVTIFPPTNAVFDAFFATDPPFKDYFQTPRGAAALLAHHATMGVRSRRFLRNEASFETLDGVEVPISVTTVSPSIQPDGVDITIGDNARLFTTAYAKNGVLHIPNKVLSPPTVIDALNARIPKYEIFVTLVDMVERKTELETTLNFTLFPPTNYALGQLGLALFRKLETPEYEIHLKSIIDNHIISSQEILSSDIQTGTTIVTDAGKTLTFTAINGSVIIDNMSEIIEADIKGSNAYAHGINAVLALPWMNETISSVLLTTGNHNTLHSLVMASASASLYDSDGTFTFFAPPNDVITAAKQNYEVLSNTDLQTPEVLDVIIKSHIVEGMWTSAMIVAGGVGETTLTAMAGNNLTVGYDGENVTVNGYAVLVPDVLATNGVVHSYGGIIVPSELPLPSNSPTALASATPSMAPTLTATPSMAPIVTATSTPTAAPTSSAMPGASAVASLLGAAFSGMAYLVAIF